MKLWVDDVRPAPDGYKLFRSVNEVIHFIEAREKRIQDLDLYGVLSEKRREELSISLIDIDHDAGDYANDGGDYIKLLDWLEETGRNYPIRIHSMNPVGIQNMRRIIQRNGWTEVK